MSNGDANPGTPAPKKKGGKKGSLKLGDPTVAGPAAAIGAAVAGALGGPGGLLGRLLHAKEELMKVLAAKEFLQASFVGRASDVSSRANIAGFAIGEKMSSGHSTNKPAVTVFVTRKLAHSAVDQDARIPPTVTVGGQEIPTDVVEVGEVIAQADPVVGPLPPGAVVNAIGVHTGRVRPAFCGASICHTGGTAGTLGALVEVDGELMVLSNNHVLANMNNARAGDRIVQPGPVDGGGPSADVVANLHSFVELDFAGDNEVDAALANNTNFDFVDPTAFAFVIDPAPLSLDDVSLHRAVRKDGRTTGLTLGRVVNKHASIRVQYGNNSALFHDQYFIAPSDRGPFSRPGDSGSLVVSADTFQPVGLLFAGSDQGTFANPIERVMNALNITRFIAAQE